MQFFNAEWAGQGDGDREKVLAKYEDYMITIKDHLPPELVRFISFFSLHDGLFTSIRLNRVTQQLKVQLVVGDEQIGYSGLKLRYHLIDIDDDLLATLAAIEKDEGAEVLYDEVLLLDEFVFAHNWLLSTHRELSIHFDLFEFEAVDVEDRECPRAEPFLVIE